MIVSLCLVYIKLLIVTLFLSIKYFNHFVYRQYDGNVLGTYQRLLSSGAFWFLNIITVFATLLPDYCMRAARDRWRRRPPRVDITNEELTHNTRF